MKKKFLSILLAVCMVLTMVPTVAWADAETTGTFGDFTVTYSGTAPTFNNNTLTFAAAGESYTIGMASGKTSTSNLIMVSAENVTLNLNGVNIVATSEEAALTVTASNTALNISADSSLTGKSDRGYGGTGRPGIEGNVSISGVDRLTVTGGDGDLNGKGGPGINGNVSVSGTVQLTVTGGTDGIYGNDGTGINGNVSVSGTVRLTVTGGGYHGASGISGTITAGTGLVVMAGSSPTSTDILTGNTTAAHYVTIALPTAAQYAEASPAAASGTDYEFTDSKTLVIKTAKGVAFWSASGTTYLDYTVKLANDINVSAFLWTPVGTENDPFTGTFDGQGHTITGLTVDVGSSSADIYAGLFGRAQGATIKNIGLIGSSVTAASTTSAYAGSIAGCAVDDTTITNCYNTGSVSAASNSNDSMNSAYAGGIVGKKIYTNITNCYSTGLVSATGTDQAEAYAGGGVGYVVDGTVSNCYYLSTAAITGTDSHIGTSLTDTAMKAASGTAGTLLSALNGWVSGKASTDYYTWKADDTTTPTNGGYPVFGSPWVLKTLTGITALGARTGISNGTAKTADALGLPKTVELITSNGNVNADVNWDVNGCSYDPSKTAEQTFTVSGTVTLPTGVVNPNNVSLTTSISVTVKAATGENPTKKTITGFLPDYTTKTVPYGTDFASLKLPDKIKAVGNELGGLWVKVTEWLHSTYQSNVPGTYTLTAVLDSGHTESGYVDSGFVLGNGVNAPEIKVTVREKSSGSNNGGSNSTPSSPATVTDKTETKVDPAGNTATVTTKPDSVNTTGNTTSIETTIPSVTVDNTPTSTNGSVVDTAKKAVVTINVPTEAIIQQLAAKKDVDLTITVPHDVARDAIGDAAITINANKDILEAAKANASDVTIKIKDADTQQLAYSWTFKGEDLAKSTTPMTDVNIAMSVHLTTEVPAVNAITPANKGLVISFDHSGVLPSVASVKFSALEKGFKPGETLYFYYYNPTTKQIEPLSTDVYTVDADGYVTVQIYHCSDYVLLPNAARSLTLDTKIYTMAPNQSYEIGVKLTNAKNATLKVYSSAKGVASITKLKNGNYKVTALKTGLTYIMFDVYDEKGKLIAKSHASVRLIVKSGVKPIGNSRRQTALF